MHRQAASALITLAWFTVAASQRSCDSQLRLLPQFRHLFRHCECQRSEWTEWAPIESVPVPTSQCPTGKALLEERSQVVIYNNTSGDCQDKREETYICEPSREEQMIIALGLGGRGQHIDEIEDSSSLIEEEEEEEEEKEEETWTNHFSDITSQHSQFLYAGYFSHILHLDFIKGRRSVREVMKRPITHRRRSASEPKPLPIDPIPFSMTHHGNRYKRQNQNCPPNSTQHILFVMDTSGSIRIQHFRKTVNVLADLVPLFCKPIKVAVMTFDDVYYSEFCFNTFDNTCFGRIEAGDAIASINYRGEWTHTAGAAKCVCDFMLSPTCGLSPTADCIDVVFITDGHSNDPQCKVCDAVKCLHNRFGVSTYAIGITDNVNQEELDCITNHNQQPGFHLFKFDDFDDFENATNHLETLLLDPNPNNTHVCINPQGTGTDACT